MSKVDATTLDDAGMQVLAKAHQKGLWHSLESRVRRFTDSKDPLRRPAHGQRVTGGVHDYLGFNKAALIAHFDRQFLLPQFQGMSWLNKHTKGEYNPEGHPRWVLDHHVPLDQAQTFDDVIRLSQLENLRPRWYGANALKGNAFDTRVDDRAGLLDLVLQARAHLDAGRAALADSSLAHMQRLLEAAR